MHFFLQLQEDHSFWLRLKYGEDLIWNMIKRIQAFFVVYRHCGVTVYGLLSHFWGFSFH